MRATGFDFSDPAELFIAKRRPGRATMDYRRFETAAEAIRYCIETVPRSSLPATTMDVNGASYRYNEIRRLYDSDAYPLERQSQGK